MMEAECDRLRSLYDSSAEVEAALRQELMCHRGEDGQPDDLCDSEQ